MHLEDHEGLESLGDAERTMLFVNAVDKVGFTACEDVKASEKFRSTGTFCKGVTGMFRKTHNVGTLVQYRCIPKGLNRRW